jgi:hypothetical protein
MPSEIPDNDVPQRDGNALKNSVCKHLRSKGMYVTGQMNPAEDYEQMGDGHCWCLQTMHELGPDDQFAERDECGPVRSCFESQP